MYYINCRMFWVQLSGTQRPRLLSQFSFYLILILIYFNAKRSTARSMPIAPSQAQPANFVEGSAGSDEAPLVGNHLGSGESLFSTRKTCVPSRSARKWGLASSPFYSPPPPIPKAPTACSCQRCRRPSM